MIEKAKEYNMNLYVAFVDYQKAFDSIFNSIILLALKEAGVEEVYKNYKEVIPRKQRPKKPRTYRLIFPN